MLTPFRHFSATAGLTRLDPDYRGSGTVGAEKARRRDYPKLWVNRFYIGLPAYVKEACLGRHEYVGEIDAARLYDLSADSAGFYAQAIAECKASGRYGIADRGAWWTACEKLIAEAGWLGYYSQQLCGAAAVFVPLDVRPA